MAGGGAEEERGEGSRGDDSHDPIAAAAEQLGSSMASLSLHSAGEGPEEEEESFDAMATLDAMRGMCRARVRC